MCIVPQLKIQNHAPHWIIITKSFFVSNAGNIFRRSNLALIKASLTSSPASVCFSNNFDHFFNGMYVADKICLCTWNWINMRRVSYPPGSSRNHTHFRLQRNVMGSLIHHIITITIYSFLNSLVFVKTPNIDNFDILHFFNLIPAVEDDVALFSNLNVFFFTERLWYVIGLLQTVKNRENSIYAVILIFWHFLLFLNLLSPNWISNHCYMLRYITLSKYKIYINRFPRRKMSWLRMFPG